MVDKSLKELVDNKKLSYSQNFEDITLSRALEGVVNGFYIDIGAAWPDEHSVTKLFYDAGWKGINIDPNEKMYQSLVFARDRDINLNVGVSDQNSELEFYCFDDLGLSSFSHEIVLEHCDVGRVPKDSYKKIVVEVVTLSSVFDEHVQPNQEVHFLKIDAEGYESKVVLSNDWKKNRPWIIVCEATSPGTMAESGCEFDKVLIDNGYVFSYFDQLNRFYVAKEKEDLIPKLSLPPSSFDEFVKYEDVYKFWQREMALQKDFNIVLEEKNNAHVELDSLRNELDSARNELVAIENERSIVENELVAAENELVAAENELVAAENELVTVKNELVTVKNELVEVRSDFDVVLNSKSWFLTRPFRKVLKLFNRDVRSFTLRGKLIVFLVSSRRLQPVKRLVKKSPRFERYLKRKLFYGRDQDLNEYEVIVLHGLEINIYRPALLDSRGIGRVANGIVSELKRRAQRSSKKISDRVYFYPALNISPAVLDQPSVLMVHDTIPLDFQDVFPDSVVQEWQEFGKIVKQASKIVTISESSSNDLMKHFDAPKSKCTTVYNGVAKINYQDEGEYTKPGNTDKAYYILLGSTDIHKNTKLMLQVWGDVKVSDEFDLLIVGDSSRISELWDGDLPSGVYTTGYVTDDKLGVLLSNAEGLLFPSLKEGFGLPPFEAALLGVPSICSDRPAMNELLMDAALFVDPSDKEGWIEAIFKLSIDLKLREEIVVKAIAKAEGFSIERNVDSLLTVLNSAAHTGGVIDLFLRSALSLVMDVNTSGKKIIPLSSLSLVQNAVPYVWGYYSDLDEVDAVLFHKGELDFLPTRLLEYLRNRMTFAYGDPVYNLYLRENIEIEPQGIDHKLDLEKLHNDRMGAFEVTDTVGENKPKMNIGVVTANHMGNIGDDAITIAAVNMLTKVYPDDIVSLASMPFSRNSYDAYDILVIGGGGLFYDADFSNAANYCNVMLYANEMSKKCFCIGVGVQGIRTELGSELFKEALNTVEFSAVRNKRDKEILESIGVQSSVAVTQDIVFSLPYRIKSEPGVEKDEDAKPVAIIALLDSRNLLAARHMVSYQKALEESVEYLSESFELKFLCQSLDDLSLYRDLKKDVGGEIITCSYDELDSIGEIYQAADLVVTSRFHGLIFSILFRKPVLAIGTNGSKIERLISHSIPSLRNSLIPIKSFSLDAFKEKTLSFIANPTDFIVEEDERRAAIELANETAEIIKSFRQSS